MTLTELLHRRTRRMRKCDPSGCVADNRYFVTVYLQDRVPLCTRYRENIMQAIDTMQFLFPGLRVESSAVMPSSIVLLITTQDIRASEAELATAFSDLLIEEIGEEVFRRIGYYELVAPTESVVRKLFTYALSDQAPGQMPRGS